MSSKKQSVSEKFFDLINPAPSLDPEDDLHEDTVAKVVDKDDSLSEDEQQTPGFRIVRPFIQTDEDEDKRYVGQKISRKKLMKQSLRGDKDVEQSITNAPDYLSTSVDWESDEEDGDNDYDSEEVDYGDEEQEEKSEMKNDDDEVEIDEQEESKDEQEGSEQSSEEQEDCNSIQHISAQAETNIEKGNAVRNQLKLWDNLLECRIQFQKSLLAANKLPQHMIFPQFEISGGSKFKKEVTQTKYSLTNLLEKLIMFQNVMFKSYSETRNLGEKKAQQSDEEIPSDSEEEHTIYSAENIEGENEPTKAKRRKLEDYAKLLESQHKEYLQYRNETIQKWNDKTRLYVGKLSNRNFSSFEQSTIKQIEQILSNRQRLIQRTQLKRSAYKILGCIQPSDHQISSNNVPDATDDNENKNKAEETKDFDTEIFDDTDFYHQLLREIIERKALDITDPIQLGRQWIELQKLRSKMKRKVDTRATKGRKIRYVVHPKLANFMAPVPECTWKDEAKTELYNSLFGSNSI